MRRIGKATSIAMMTITPISISERLAENNMCPTESMIKMPDMMATNFGMRALSSRTDSHAALDFARVETYLLRSGRIPAPPGMS